MCEQHAAKLPLSARAGRACEPRHLLAWLAMFFITFLCAGSVLADAATVPGESVANRVRPELDPQGMPLGAFRLYPSVDWSAKYDSNIFAEREDEVFDWIFGFSPSLNLESDWVRHSLDISADANIGRFEQNEQEDFDDFSVRANLDYDLSYADVLKFAAQYDLSHDDRFSPDDAQGIVPTEYELGRLFGTYARRTARTSLRIGLRQTRLDYENVLSTSGIVNNKDRNRDETLYSVRAGYQVRPGLDFFLQADIDAKNYDTLLDDNNVNRNSDSRSVAIGVEGVLTGAAYVEAFLGYSERDYEDDALVDIDTPWLEGRLVWNVSGLTTLTFEGLRDIRETTLNQASGYTLTRFGITADHELFRNFLLRATVARQTDKYIGIEREDDNDVVALSMRYLLNRYTQIALELRQYDRESAIVSSSPDDFDIRTASLTIRIQR